MSLERSGTYQTLVFPECSPGIETIWNDCLRHAEVLKSRDDGKLLLDSQRKLLSAVENWFLSWDSEAGKAYLVILKLTEKDQNAVARISNYLGVSLPYMPMYHIVGIPEVTPDEPDEFGTFMPDYDAPELHARIKELGPEFKVRLVAYLSNVVENTRLAYQSGAKVIKAIEAEANGYAEEEDFITRAIRERDEREYDAIYGIGPPKTKEEPEPYNDPSMDGYVSDSEFEEMPDEGYEVEK